MRRRIRLVQTTDRNVNQLQQNIKQVVEASFDDLFALGEAGSGIVLRAKAKALTSASAIVMASIILPPGDWDLGGFVGLEGSSTAVTQHFFIISPTAGALSDLDNGRIGGVWSINLNSADYAATLPRLRISLTRETTYYLNVYAVFAAGTANAYGQLTARRASPNGA